MKACNIELFGEVLSVTRVGLLSFLEWQETFEAIAQAMASAFRWVRAQLISQSLHHVFSDSAGAVIAGPTDPGASDAHPRRGGVGGLE